MELQDIVIGDYSVISEGLAIDNPVLHLVR